MRHRLWVPEAEAATSTSPHPVRVLERVGSEGYGSRVSTETDTMGPPPGNLSPEVVEKAIQAVKDFHSCF